MASIGLDRINLTRSDFVRPGIVLATLALSALVGLQSPGLSVRGIPAVEVAIIVIALTIFVVITLRYIEFGALSLVMAAFFSRMPLPTGTNAAIPVSLGLAAMMIIVWIASMLVQGKVRLLPSRCNVPLIGFVLVAILSLPWGWLFWRPEIFSWRAEIGSNAPFYIVQFGALAVMILLPGVFLLALNVLKSDVWIGRLQFLMVLIAVPQLIQLLTGSFPSLARIIGINGPGLYHQWLIALLYAQILFNSRLRAWQRIFFGVLVVAYFGWAFIIRINWVSGWMPPMIAIVLLTFMRSKRLGVALLLLGILAYMSRSQYFYQAIWLQSQSEDFNRFWLWPTIIFDLTLGRVDPLFGAGPAGYAPYFMTFFPGRAMSAHNNYVDIFAQTGIAGFVFFCWFLFSVLRTGWGLRKQLTDPFVLAFSNGVFAGFVGMLFAMMTNDWFVPFAYNSGLMGFDQDVYAWILLGAMVGLEQRVRGQGTLAPVPTG